MLQNVCYRIPGIYYSAAKNIYKDKILYERINEKKNQYYHYLKYFVLSCELWNDL